MLSAIVTTVYSRSYPLAAIDSFGLMLLAVIVILLLIGNWFISETLVFVPVDLLARLTSVGWWALGLMLVAFLAWCIGDD